MSNKKINFSLIFGTFIVCFFLGVIYYLIFYSPAFKVKKIKIFGVKEKKLITAEVENVLFKKKPIVFLPNNILFWSDSFLKKEKSTWLNFSKLTLRKNFRERIVSIVAQKRKPAGIACFEKKCFFFDKNGFVFTFAPYSEGSLYPIIIKSSPISLGNYLLNKKYFSILLNYLNQLKSGFLIADLYKINEQNKEMAVNVHYFYPKGKIENNKQIKFVLYLSLDFSIPNLNKELKTLSKKIDFSKIKYIDLRIKDKVYYKF